MERISVTLLMPCLNEAETLAMCIRKAKSSIRANNLDAQILIADNGSTDGSIEIAKAEGAQVINIPKKGYGAALIGGIKASSKTFIVMGDADDSYSWDELSEFFHELLNGADLVVGNRFTGGIEPGAMPWLHKYIGNPALSFLGRIFFGLKIKDFHCGLRAFRRDAIQSLDL